MDCWADLFDRALPRLSVLVRPVGAPNRPHAGGGARARPAPTCIDSLETAAAWEQWPALGHGSRGNGRLAGFVIRLHLLVPLSFVLSLSFFFTQGWPCPSPWLARSSPSHLLLSLASACSLASTMYGSARNARAFRRSSESEAVPPAPEDAEDGGPEMGEADPSAPPSLYAALGVSPSADQETIRRAFRQLAASLHPDKARDPAAREGATHLFARIQHAYEVLSDPELRDIYDVYGEEGLEAGNQVAVRPRGARAREAPRDGAPGGTEDGPPPPPPPQPQAEVEHRGQYVFKVDATALVDPYDRRARTLPDLRGVFVSSGVDVPVDTTDWGAFASASDVAHLGGLVSVQRSQGGGSFVAGYKRVYDDSSSYEVQAVVGLQTLVSATSSVQLSRHAAASITATWQPGLGPGLQFETSRQLSEKFHGQFGWTLGPEPLAGMHLSVTRRSPGLLMLGRVDVGATTALAVRVAKRLAKSITGRLGAKLTPAGPELEAGCSRRLNELDACGMRAVAAPHGVSLRLSYSRGLHAFECPILLSPHPNPVVAVAAAILPPLSVWVAESLIFKPLSRGIRRRR